MNLHDNVSIHVSGSPVTLSGSVIALADDTIKLALDDSHSVVVIFLDDAATTGSAIRWNILDDSTLQMTLVNHNSAVGTGTTAPIEFATSTEGNLLLHYRVFDLQHSSKLFHYTICVNGKQVTDEQ